LRTCNFAWCPLVSGECACPRALLRTENDGTDGQTADVRPRPLYYVYTARRGQRNVFTQYRMAFGLVITQLDTSTKLFYSQLVSWSLTSPFSTNMAISETKGQGWSAVPTQ